MRLRAAWNWILTSWNRKEMYVRNNSENSVFSLGKLCITIIRNILPFVVVYANEKLFVPPYFIIFFFFVNPLNKENLF